MESRRVERVGPNRVGLRFLHRLWTHTEDDTRFDVGSRPSVRPGNSANTIEVLRSDDHVPPEVWATSVPIRRMSGRDNLPKDVRFHVAWSGEDAEYAGTCEAFPSLSFLDADPTKALLGIMRLVREERKSR